MDKETFENEIWDRLDLDQVAMLLEQWQEARSNLIGMSPLTRAVDPQLIQAALACQADRATILDGIAPDFRERLRAYRELQSRLIEDLQKIQKHPAKKLAIFRTLLSRL